MPAILVEPPREAKVSQMEIFGPVTCVYGYDDLDAAIDTANSLPFAFQASVFSRDIGPALHAAHRLDAAAVMINDHTAFRTDWMPFAGRRQSGYGIGGIPGRCTKCRRRRWWCSATAVDGDPLPFDADQRAPPHIRRMMLAR